MKDHQKQPSLVGGFAAECRSQGITPVLTISRAVCIETQEEEKTPEAMTLSGPPQRIQPEVSIIE
jgi:hypothetical protein